MKKKLNLRKQDGAISLFTILAMLFFIVFILGVVATMTVKHNMQLETASEVKDIYTKDATSAYDAMISDSSDIIPIYTKEQLFAMAMNSTEYFEINGKVYKFKGNVKEGYEIKTPIYITTTAQDFSNLSQTAKDNIRGTYNDYFRPNIIIDGKVEIEYEEEILTLPDFDGSWADGKGVNLPNLANGKLIPVYWDSSGNEKVVTKGTNGEFNQYELRDWYNDWKYEEQTGNTDGKTSKWANAKTEDGSYWVWIPRFAYKITSNLNYNATNSGTIDIVFVDVSNENGNTIYANAYPTVSGINGSKTMDNYVVHPAFGIDITKGGWDNNLPGFWVAKFSMSLETSTNSGSTWSITNTTTTTLGNVATVDTGTTRRRVVSRPSSYIWRNISAQNMYNNSYNYDRTIESHLMKNSEWGAVVYLADSKYGRNETRMMMNNNGNYKTGFASYAYNSASTTTERPVGDTSTTGTFVYNNTFRGVLASTTGNIYGVYDMAGGVSEAVASFVDNGNSNVNSNGAILATNKNTKYVMPYSKAGTESTANNYTASGYNVVTGKYGDAIFETSNRSSSNTDNRAWFTNYSGFPATTNAFLMRGGAYNSTANAGIFAFQGFTGAANASVGFRVVLCP